MSNGGNGDVKGIALLSQLTGIDNDLLSTRLRKIQNVAVTAAESEVDRLEL
jgi:hypothetical protein